MAAATFGTIEICLSAINQLFHEDNCHIVAFIVQENQVKWVLPKNLGPILELVETPEVEAAKKLWTHIYNEKQAKSDRLETSWSKREELKRKQLEAANTTVTNLSPVSFSVQEIKLSGINNVGFSILHNGNKMCFKSQTAFLPHCRDH
ncbi:hypothetical protein GHT06_020138 [Daphnia sinensis]|uniref:Uncharacterized protein n=1 Tax=Daphnia sinensis TaxID=1820382 RepID=A0AAD5L2L2_9CRUS|nr:hypothetical protein GHT06_020138 [Daphnia sinensis]